MYIKLVYRALITCSFLSYGNKSVEVLQDGKVQ